ncbi:MAG: hypothetical protein ACM3O7_11920 [Acidobacteriota bacterium]
MKLDVPRDVIGDLWPLVRGGEASAASRSLVETYLAEDAAFGETLRKAELIAPSMPAIRLSADAERRLLDDARERARIKLILVGVAIATASLALLAALAGALFFFGRAGL